MLYEHSAANHEVQKVTRISHMLQGSLGSGIQKILDTLPVETPKPFISREFLATFSANLVKHIPHNDLPVCKKNICQNLSTDNENRTILIFSVVEYITVKIINIVIVGVLKIGAGVNRWTLSSFVQPMRPSTTFNSR